MPLTPENKAKIVAALRSGEYTQARGKLGEFDKKHLCCIGVAAHRLGYKEKPYTDGVDSRSSRAGNFVGLAKSEIQLWVKWNDYLKFDFEAIAKLIEKGF